MAAPTIIKGEEHFFISKYEGNGGGQRVGNFVPYTDNGTIAKSCIFNAPDDPDLTRNLGSNGNRSKFTISTWIKRNSFPGSFMAVVTGGLTSSNDGFFFTQNGQISDINLFAALHVNGKFSVPSRLGQISFPNQFIDASIIKSFGIVPYKFFQ